MSYCVNDVIIVLLGSWGGKGGLRLLLKMMVERVLLGSVGGGGLKVLGKTILRSFPRSSERKIQHT